MQLTFQCIIPSILYLSISGTFPQNGHGNRFMKATILLVFFILFSFVLIQLLNKLLFYYAERKTEWQQGEPEPWQTVPLTGKPNNSQTGAPLAVHSSGWLCPIFCRPWCYELRLSDAVSTPAPINSAPPVRFIARNTRWLLMMSLNLPDSNAYAVLTGKTIMTNVKPKMSICGKTGESGETNCGMKAI